MPEISVIIPVFNKYKYIENSLRSVLEQPFRDLEVIAVNDGSTDESLAVLNQGMKRSTGSGDRYSKRRGLPCQECGAFSCQGTVDSISGCG